MATVTIGKPYFEALLRRAEFHTSEHNFDVTPGLTSSVTISKAEHAYLLQAVREYNLLKNALFRGGLAADTLDTLLAGEDGVTKEEHAMHSSNILEGTFVSLKSGPVTITAPCSSDETPDSSNTAVGDGLVHPRAYPNSYSRLYSLGQPDSSIDTPDKYVDFHPSPHQRIPMNDQRTILISNLSERTTHKDLVDIIRGGRLLDIFLRNDRSATVSFVEGAAEFLAYTKRKDIYLHTKRIEFRWNERQFHVPAHVSNKITNGATRNLVVRGVGGKLTTEQICDHLDHIHNLVVVDIQIRNSDAYISTNSIHNALFARTCMMSRTAYKHMRIDWYPDECAAPLPKPPSNVHVPIHTVPSKVVPVTNRYMVLGDDETRTDSDEDTESYLTSGVRVNNWADTAVA